MNNFELQLQRLVDGQLDRQQIQELLAEVGANDLWRDVTAAFVEEQIWHKEINATIASPEIMAADHESKQVVLAENTPSLPAPSFPWIKFGLATAAAIFLGIWLGQSLGTSNGGPANTPEHSIASNEPVDSMNNGTSSGRVDQLVDNTPSHRLSMGDAGEVPLYTLEQARKFGFLDQPSVPAETVKQFREKGYQLEQNTRYISGKAKDGRRVLVPIRSVLVNPGN